ncbi:MAG: hypothetical protein JSS27_04745 [Planctomycetes bacterium]|nr:hypothetical protein [Planctomycetota bacterium]
MRTPIITHERHIDRRPPARFALAICECLAIVVALASSAHGQTLLTGEFDDIPLGRELIDAPRVPTLTELRAAVAKPEIEAVLMFKLYGDANNHYVPVWSADGQSLSFQRSDARAGKSKLLLFTDLTRSQPTSVGEQLNAYDFMFRWGINAPGSWSFCRLQSSPTSSQICFSTDGAKLEVKATGAQRRAMPSLYRRTDGIWRLLYEQDGNVMHQAWNEAQQVEPPRTLAQGSAPRWSKSGASFTYLRLSNPGTAQTSELLVRQLLEERDLPVIASRSGRLRGPSWSPPEQHVACFFCEVGERQPWRIAVARVGESPSVQLVGDDVVVDQDFDSEGPGWDHSGRGLWYFTHAQRQDAYYPLVSTNIETGQSRVIHYPKRITTPTSLAVNPASGVPEIAIVAHDKKPQDVFVVFMNHE